MQHPPPVRRPVVRYAVPITLIVVSDAESGWIEPGTSTASSRSSSPSLSRAPDNARVAQAFGLRAWRAE
jgi:thiamine pyrophosphate-dependent acetolactate synthase large subunit-like protein